MEHALTQNPLIINSLWNGNIFPNCMFLILSEELNYYLQALKQKVNTVQNKNLKYKEHIPPIVIFRLLKSDSLLIISFYPQVITLSDLPKEQKTLS